MKWTLRGRIPECSKFGEIAQNLDAVCAELANSTQWHPITCAERDQLAAENARLREALRMARPFVAYAYDQGIVGAEDAGVELDAALAAQPGGAE